jgi:hypothetical protein
MNGNKCNIHGLEDIIFINLYDNVNQICIQCDSNEKNIEGLSEHSHGILRYFSIQQ